MSKSSTQSRGLSFITGDLWERWKHGHPVVIPTNIGWTLTDPLRNIMGRGLAFQAKKRFPGIDQWYGSICYHCREVTPVVDYDVGLHRGPVLLFPTKPLNPDKPHLSWDQNSSYDQIRCSLVSLLLWMRIKEKGIKFPICLPLVGCGNGELNPTKVRDILHEGIPSYDRDNFLIVDRGGV